MRLHLEAGALSGAGLLLHRHDLHDLVLESRSEEELDYLVLLDGHGEQVDLLHALDLALWLVDNWLGPGWRPNGDRTACEGHASRTDA